MIVKTVDGWNLHTDGTWVPEDEMCTVRVKDDEIRIDLDEELHSDELEAGIVLPRFVILDLVSQMSPVVVDEKEGK